MKTLTEQFAAILREYKRFPLMTKQTHEALLQAVKERDEYVIGELGSIDIEPEHGDIHRFEGANNARIAIKKRMEESL